MKNIEDWDFRKCRDSTLPEYDVAADLFLSTNYVRVLAVDALRISYIQALVDAKAAAMEPDGENVRLLVGDDFLKGFKSGNSRFTNKGRLARTIVDSLRREHRKNGRLRVSVLPSTLKSRSSGASA